MTGSQLLVQSLEECEVSRIFGMPGGHTAGIYDALYQHPSIRHILCRNEHAGAFMADGYARVTGRPGVALVAAGPGLTNALTGLGAAYSDSVPLFLISGQIPGEAIGRSRGYFHEMDSLALTSPLTKWNACAKSATEIPRLMARAFREMSQGRPRPVHLEVPVDVLNEEASSSAAGPVVEPALRSEIPNIEAAAELLQHSRKPLILAGGGVISTGACRELTALAERLNAPVLTTPMGKGAVSEEHPLAFGLTWRRITSDLTGMKENLSPLPEQADAVLAIGCRFSQLATGNWELELPGDIIHVDIDADEIGRNYPAEVGIVADARAALQALLDLIEPVPSGSVRCWAESCGKTAERERWRIEGFDIAPVLRSVLDRDAIVSCDITRLYYMMLANFPVYEPRTFLHPSCFITMGYGLPAALGAKAAFPSRQVIAIAGDGGFLMTGQELACAVQEKLHIVVILINDNCLSAMKGIQNRSYGSRHIAVDLKNPDFIRLAESYGALGLKVTGSEELEPSLREALNAGCPALIEVQAPQTAV